MVAIGAISYLGSHGAEVLRAGWTEPVVDPGIEDWARADPASSPARPTPRTCAGAACGSRTRARSSPSTGAARPTRRRRARRSTRSRRKAEAAGLRTHWGRKVLEVRPPVRIDKGAGISSFLADTDVDVAMYVGDDVTDLDAFHALVALAEEGRISKAIRVGVRSDEATAGDHRGSRRRRRRARGRRRAARGPGRRVSRQDRREVLGLPAHHGPDQRRRRRARWPRSRSRRAAGTSDDLLVPVAAGWWVARGPDRHLAGAAAETSLADRVAAGERAHPGLAARGQPARTVLNRLWPLLFSTIGAGALAFLVPQVPAVATGFAIIWSLAWRRQASAVTAIEERDGARFYVEQTSPLKPIRLIRTPGFRSNLFELNGASGQLAGGPGRRAVITSGLHPQPRQQRLPHRAAVPARLRARVRVRGGGGDPRHAVAVAEGRAGTRTSPTRCAMWGFPAGLIGGRIYFLITTPSQIARTTGGGRSRSGRAGSGSGAGSRAACSAGLWIVRQRLTHGDVLRFMDAAAPALLVAQAIGRIGNYFNQELFGKPIDAALGAEDLARAPAGRATLQYATFQPTFLYEIIWNLALAGVPGLARPPPQDQAARAVRAVRRRLLGLPDLRGDAPDRLLQPHPRDAAELLDRVDAVPRRAGLVRADPARGGPLPDGPRADARVRARRSRARPTAPPRPRRAKSPSARAGVALSAARRGSTASRCARPHRRDLCPRPRVRDLRARSATRGGRWRSRSARPRSRRRGGRRS